MKMTTEDYSAMVTGFDRLEPIAIKEYGSIEKYYKAVWLYACEHSKEPKMRYVWLCFQIAKIHFGKYTLSKPYYNVITDNDYNDCHIETAVKRYLKSKGFDYYDK